ncbi:MAG: hypothetical protein MUF27_02200 [Acidobacteria bacterium]|jgi:hypothetical protein|nr:hypothetical protein [Acidobacteriota bacterium]
MPTDAPRSTVLRLRRPVGRTLALALLFAVVAAAALEAVARIDGVRERLSPESVGSGQQQLDRKLVLLREAIADGGPVDALFLGSSQVHRAVDPALAAGPLRAASGRDLRLFNFGLNGISEVGQVPVAKILTKKFGPRLLVVGVSSYGMDDRRDIKFGEALEASPWFRYHAGRPDLDGFLLEHSCAMRQYQGYLFWASPDAEQLEIQERAVSGMGADGHGAFEPGRFRDVDDEAAAALADFRVSPSHVEALDRLFALRSPELAIVAVEMPVHPHVIERYGRGAADHAAALAAIGAVAARHGIPFWRFPGEPPVPADAWHDFVHLNRRGTALYSAWLGDRLGEALKSGEVELPGGR